MLKCLGFLFLSGCDLFGVVTRFGNGIIAGSIPVIPTTNCWTRRVQIIVENLLVGHKAGHSVQVNVQILGVGKVRSFSLALEARNRGFESHTPNFCSLK